MSENGSDVDTRRRADTRSRSRSKSPKERRSRRRRSSTYSRSPQPASTTIKRLHIANLDDTVRKRDVEDAFERYGRLTDVWVASYPPFYAFVVYENSEDAERALKEMRNGSIHGVRIRTSVALPRIPRSGGGGYGRGGGGYGRGYDGGYGGRGYGGGDRDRYRRRSRSRSPRYDRSRSRSRSRS